MARKCGLLAFIDRVALAVCPRFPDAAAARDGINLEPVMKHPFNVRPLRLGAWVLALTVYAVASVTVRAQPSGLSREYYSGIPGNSVADLTGSPDFPDRPAFRDVLTVAFETGQNIGDNYGQRIRGFVRPPQSGEYVFWIASDDHSVLYLSPDEHPSGKRVIARVNAATGFRAWFSQPGQQSAPVRLEAGRNYYIEALMKEGGGSDHLSVRWALPFGGVEEPIPAVNFVPFETPLYPPEITRQPASVTVAEGSPATFRVEVRNTDPLGYQWQRNGTPLPGAAGPVLALARAAMTDDGARFRVTLVNALGFLVSEEAVLRVTADTTPPTLVTAYNAGSSEVVVRFSEPVREETALVAGNYALDRGAAVSGVRWGSADDEVILTTSPLESEATYTLTVNGVTDRAASPNAIAPDTRRVFTVLRLSPVTIGRLTFPATIEPVSGGLNIAADGGGLWGTNDHVHFSQQVRTGDFDVRVRIESLELTSLFSQAGLMVRQSLATNSPFAAAVATPSLAGSQFAWRGATGAVVQASGAFPVNYPETWLRLRRQGTNFTGFASYDGYEWASLGRVGIGMSNAVHLGVFVGSRSTQAVARVAFRDFGEVEDGTPLGALPARIEPLGPSSRTTGVVISEIMYHPSAREDGRVLEYIEVFNADSVFADLGGYRIDGSVQYTFPAGTRLAAGDFLVVAQAPGDMAAEYGLEGVLGPWSGRLPRDAGLVQLRHRAGALLLNVEYSDQPPWPVEADGAGHSLVLARPSYGEGDPRAWGPSEFRGGSPGRREFVGRDPWRGVVINEALAHPGEGMVDFIELYHRGEMPVDLSGGILTDDPARARFVIPDGTVIEPGGVVAWDREALGFGLTSAGEELYLIRPDGARVVDAVRFGAQMRGLSSGRAPDGADTWRHLDRPTPGAGNAPAWLGPIVISELMYHPPVGEPGQFVELHNRGTEPVNLRDWRFVEGISFVFPDDAVVPPGGYFVVAKDLAYLREAYPDLPPDRMTGNFGGNLSNSGERVALARPEPVPGTDATGAAVTNVLYVTVEEVTYRDGGRWGRWSDGGGSSLELVDTRADSRLAGNWADSDETGKGSWTTLDVTGLLELGVGTPSELQVMLLRAGECLIDNVQVVDESGANLVVNPGFEGGLNGWIAQGNHVASGLGTNGYQSPRSLHLRASAGGDNGANRIKTVLRGSSLTENSTARIRADVRWMRGHPELLMRLKGNYLEGVVELPVPRNLGTPGEPNSRRVSNAGPAVYEVAHAPVVPAAMEPVRVTARVHDPDGVGPVRLRYRFDPSVTVQEVPMRDDGREGDRVAGDGIYTATIPGQAEGVLVAFWVEAADGAVVPATATFPADPQAGACLVRFGDATPAGSFGTYRLWMTQANTDTWTQREYMSNEALDGTIVYGNHRAIYNAGARYRGSPFIRPNYNGPMGALCGYIWTTPSDDRLLGSDEFNLDWLEQPGRDPTLQRERMSFWIGDQLGVPFSHTRYIQVYVNGIRRGLVYTDSQQPNGEYMSSWFPEADRGEIFKIDDWFEFNTAVEREFNRDARLEAYPTRQGGLTQTRYRWNWERKSNRGLDDDYSSLINLVEVLNLPDGEAYDRRVAETLDLDGWLGPIVTRRVVGDWDGYGYRRGKNTFAYLPPGGRWNLLLWDLDFSLGGGSDGETTEIFQADDPVMTRLYRHPHFGRVYLQLFAEAVRGPLASGVADPLMDANHAAMQAHGLNAAAPAPVKSWIANRRLYLAGVLATNTAPWSVDGEGTVTSDSNVLTLTGTAPIEVRTISVNGAAYQPVWTTRTNWTLSVPLRAGANRLVLEGLNRHGQRVSGASEAVDVEFTGADEAPEDFVRITEIMYEPLDPDAEFVEIRNLSERTTFDLSGWFLDGVNYEFPGGTALPPGAYRVMVKDPTIFAREHGGAVPVLGAFLGRLDNAGETLRLLRPGTPSNPWILVDEVTYGNRPPWPSRARGLGGSLQVIDPAQDNRRPSNWGAVDADGHGHAVWRFVSVTDRARSSVLRLSLGSPGEVHVDDLSLVAGMVPRVGTELVTNGGFEEALAPHWSADPAVAGSFIDPEVRRSGRSSLRLVAGPDGFNAAASVRQTLAVPVVEGQFYTLSFWYLAGRHGGDLTVRLDGGGVQTVVDARERPIAFATPGGPSSMAATLPPFPDVWINEVLPQPVAGAGTAPWIEIHNAGSEAVSLTGWFLSNDPGAPGRWAFPAGSSLGAGEFRVVSADGLTTGPGGWRASFALMPGTGSVVLSRSHNGLPAPVDFVHYAGVGAGRSIGSFPDGAWSERRVFEVPTPGAPNDPTSLPVRVVFNEWMARNSSTIADPADGAFDDWFELYNAGSAPVDLTGYSVTDNPNNPTKSVIPPGFVLAPGAVMLVWADGQPGQNAPGRDLHVDFALSADGESLSLYSPGGTLIDHVEFGPQERDVSEGLMPDGAAGAVVRFTEPTPGRLNAGGAVETIRFTAIDAGAAGVRLEWSARAGGVYQVQFAPALGAPWANLGLPVTAAGPTAALVDPEGLGAGRFYRVMGLGGP